MRSRRILAVAIAPRITVDRRVRFGQPAIKGTRTPVAVILDEMAAGTPVEDIAREHGVAREDVRATLR